MKLSVNKKGDYVVSISIEYTPTEALVINHAMRNYVNDEDMNEINRKVMQRMLDVEPIFKETESEGKLINDFRDYQKEWLTSHNDIEFDKPDEDLILRFLDDTAACFIAEHIVEPTRTEQTVGIHRIKIREGK